MLLLRSGLCFPALLREFFPGLLFDPFAAWALPTFVVANARSFDYARLSKVVCFCEEMLKKLGCWAAS